MASSPALTVSLTRPLFSMSCLAALSVNTVHVPPLPLTVNVPAACSGVTATSVTPLPVTVNSAPVGSWRQVRLP